MKKEELYKRVMAYFEEKMPDAGPELHYRNAYELLVAVILSAQCTDKRVNEVTPSFFETYPTVEKLSEATVGEVYQKIRSISYPNNKSKHLVGMARTMMERFGGEVPSSVEKLQELPGVGRKTANVVASVMFSEPVIAVDTHVFRVANRIGLTICSKNVEMTEAELERNIPKEKMCKAHHWLILHGRYVCKARKPLCEDCGLHGECLYFSKKQKE